MLACTALSGCIGNRAIEEPIEYLSPAGWESNQVFLEHKNFVDYSNAITNEVRRFRIPFDPKRAADEVQLNSPIELPLGAHCSGQASGIAILVHGLADTAYSLRDIGGVLSDACYKSRVILLPGHATRSGDLLNTRLEDWQATINYLIDQAASETEIVLLVGFSLGSVLTLDATLLREDDIDGIIAISPAYYLSSERLAKWTPLVAPFMRWVDKGVADDPMRYEAMPTRGVAETWSAMKKMHNTLDRFGSVNIPWMLTQSMDDAVVVPEKNEALWKSHAVNPASRLIRFVSGPSYAEEEKVLNLPGSSEEDKVLALTHLAIHQSPDNPHYGKKGRYRNCGGNMPRVADGVKRCEQSETVWYGLWDTEPDPDRPMAFSTFNPSFDKLASEITSFVDHITDIQKNQ